MRKEDESVKQKNELSRYYLERFNISPEKLKLINTIRQATAGTLRNLGFSDEEISRLATPVRRDEDKLLLGVKILKKHIHPTENGRRDVYYLTHSTGTKMPISGKDVVESIYPEIKVNKSILHSRGRRDLLDSALKAAHCLSVAMKEYRSEGCKIVSIEHQSELSSRDKKGMTNEDRKPGQKYANYVFTVEEEVESLSSGSSTESRMIGVNYVGANAMGNTVKKMAKKVESLSSLDHIYVYSSRENTQKYQKKIELQNVSFRPF